NAQTGQVRPIDPASGAVQGAYVLPGAARPAGYGQPTWLIESPASSVYVTTDVGQHATIVSGINPTTGGGGWSGRRKTWPRSAGAAVAVSRCGDQVCIADGDGVTIVDPTNGRMANLAGANRVLTNGTDWAAQYEVPAAGTSVIDAVAYLNPKTFAP